MELTLSTVLVVGAFALFGLYYAFFVARRGKAKGDTARTWCMPQGHSDIGERTSEGRELAPPDECPPPREQPAQTAGDLPWHRLA